MYVRRKDVYRWVMHGLIYCEKDADDGDSMNEETWKAQRRFMGAVREDATAFEVTEEDADYRTKWRRKIRCAVNGSNRKKKKNICMPEDWFQDRDDTCVCAHACVCVFCVRPCVSVCVCGCARVCVLRAPVCEG